VVLGVLAACSSQAILPAHADGGSIVGTVRDAAGTPVPGAQLWLYDSTNNTRSSIATQSDAQGRYDFEGLAAKGFKVAVENTQERPDLVPRFAPSARTVEEAAIVTPGVGEVDVTLPEGGVISGTVSAGDGPLASACVNAEVTKDGVTAAGPMSGVSDVNGHYRVQGLDDGTYHVSFRDCRQNPVLTPVNWQGDQREASGGAVTLTLGQEVSGIDQQLFPGASAHGRVVDGSGTAVAGACATLIPTVGGYSLANATVGTGPDGTWQTTSVLAPNTLYAVSSYACGPDDTYLSSTASVTTGEAGTDVAAPDVVRSKGGSFSGTVTDQFGQPVKDVCIEPVTPANASVGLGHMDDQGHYTIAAVAPGTWTARFYDCGAGMVDTYWKSPDVTTAATFQVVAGQDRPGVDQTVIVFTLPALPLGITVARNGGIATITWSPPSDTGHTPLTGFTVTLPDGVHTLPAGTTSYRVTGLDDNVALPVSVAATNVKGTGPARTVTAPAVPTAATLGAPASVVSGSLVTVAGHLRLANGAAAGGQPVQLWRRAAGSTAAFVPLAALTTSSTGDYRFTFRLTGPTEFQISMRNGSAPRASALTRVAPRITTTSSGRVLTVATSVPRPGSKVVLQHRRADGTWVSSTAQTLNSRGTWTGTLPAGTWRAVVPASGYWAQAVGAALTLR
jgi:hypothetical protein